MLTMLVAVAKAACRRPASSCADRGRFGSPIGAAGALLLLLPLIVACGTVERAPAVPLALTEKATVLGIPNARFWPDTQASAMIGEAEQARARERMARMNAALTGPEPPANFLAVS